MLKKYRVDFLSRWHTPSYIHVFADSLNAAKEIVLTDGVGFSNGKPEMPLQILDVTCLDTEQQHTA